MIKRHWSIIVIVVLSLLWLQAGVNQWQMHNELQNIYSSVYAGEVTVQAVDSDTKAPITIIFEGPTMTVGQPWPKAVRMSSPGDVSKTTLS